MRTGEKMPSHEQERTLEESIAVVDGVLARVQEISAEKGIPLLSNGRIDMEGFEDVYSRDEISQDNLTAAGLKNRWRQERIREIRRATKGSAQVVESIYSQEQKERQETSELFEKTVVAFFHKILAPRGFAVFRGSVFDDAENSADTVIVDMATGNVVCTLDEVLTHAAAALREKDVKSMEINRQGGACMKYGIKVEGDNRQVSLGAVEKIPLLILAFERKEMEQALTVLENNVELSAGEKEVAQRLLRSLYFQLETIAQGSDYPAHIQKKAKEFWRVLAEAVFE